MPEKVDGGEGWGEGAASTVDSPGIHSRVKVRTHPQPACYHASAMPIYPYKDTKPRLGQRVFLAPSAEVTGDIELGDDVSFWFHTVARGDVHWIRIGAGTNIQDGVVLHVSHDTHPLTIGAGVVVGHSAVLHGCTIEDHALIGIGARVLDGAVVESFAQIGAGAVVTPGTRVPSGHLVLGIPARVARPLTAAEKQNILDTRDRYIDVKNEYSRVLGPGY
jgi:carbonic anhydrase/acetyltransferase-like protein (isoleucine patch superfamily)